MSREVYIHLSEPPLATERLSEQLRMALGLVINDNLSLTLLFSGEARHALEGLDEAAVGMSPMGRSLSMLKAMKARLLAETGGSFNYDEALSPETFEPGELDSFMDNADIWIG